MPVRLLNLPGKSVSLRASADSRRRKFNLVAYNGGPMNLQGFDFPVIVDLDSIKIPKSVPLLYQHNHNEILGPTENVRVEDYTIVASGEVSNTTPKADEVRHLADSGFDWQLSIGATSPDVTFLASGQKATVNNRPVSGPVYIARNSNLHEITFCSVGRDFDTVATLVASFLGGVAMTFEEWVASVGIDIATLSDESKAVLQVVYDYQSKDETEIEATLKDKTEEEKKEIKASMAVKVMEGLDSIKKLQKTNPLKVVTKTGDNKTVTNPVVVDVGSHVATLRASHVAESTRLETIDKLAKKYNNPEDSTHKKPIAILASAEGWTPERTELAMVLASRPSIPTGGSKGNEQDSFRILEAAFAQSGNGLPDKLLQASFSAPVLEQAHKKYKGRLGLQELIHASAQLNGYQGAYSGRLFRDPTEHRQLLASAFSTVDLPGIMSNNVNKYLMVGYNMVEDTWEKIASFTSVSNFLTHTGYRGMGNFLAEEVPQDGHIKHGTMGEESFTNAVKTYAKMFAITRQAQINDDLGMFQQVPKMLGRGQKLKIVRAFWTAFLATAGNFWHADNANVSTGVLGITGLGAANTVFMNQVDSNGEFIGAEPKYLLVPTGLYPLALQLNRDTQIASGITTAGGIPDSNPWAGKFEALTSRYLSDTSITGSSAVKYYLLADPNEVPVIEVAFLDGNRNPYVETAEVDFSQLGIQMRTYWDWGIARVDPNGGVQSSGA